MLIISEILWIYTNNAEYNPCLKRTDNLLITTSINLCFNTPCAQIFSFLKLSCSYTCPRVTLPLLSYTTAHITLSLCLQSLVLFSSASLLTPKILAKVNCFFFMVFPSLQAVDNGEILKKYTYARILSLSMFDNGVLA